MREHSVFGVSIPEKGWVPAPRYLLRRNRILQIMRNMPRGRVLDVGSGSGALIRDLTKLGFICDALETSESAREFTKYTNQGLADITVYSELASVPYDTYDYVLSFEVLEHIENDSEALLFWKKWLKSEGKLLISVPSHQRKWGASDIWAGHCRRYEKKDLRKLVLDSGYSIEILESYGFPLANIIAPIRNKHHRYLLRQEEIKSVDYKSKSDDEKRQEHNDRSGVERVFEGRFYKLQSGFIGTKILQISFLLQYIFRNTDLGDGYLLLATKNE